jgi:hypothetical protein
VVFSYSSLAGASGWNVRDQCVKEISSHLSFVSFVVPTLPFLRLCADPTAHAYAIAKSVAPVLEVTGNQKFTPYTVTISSRFTIPKFIAIT